MTPITLDRALEDAITVRASELLSVKQYAHMMQLDPQTVYRRIWTGRQKGVVRDADGQYRIDVVAAFRA